MNLTYQMEDDVLAFLKSRSEDSARYLIKMTHLERNDKVSESDLITCKIILNYFGNIKPLNQGSNEDFETKLDECMHNALTHFNLIEPLEKKLTLKEKIIEFFKPNKGFI